MLNDTDMSFHSFIEKLKQSVVIRNNKLEQYQLGIDTPKRNAKAIKKNERIRKELNEYDQKTPEEILEILAYNVKLD